MRYFPSGIRLTLADVVTMLGLLFSILATFFIFQGLFLQAYGLILLQIILDALDGRIARLQKSEHTLGASLDSFADFYTIVNVALFGFFSGMNHPFTLVVLVLFILSGALRLSIFSVVGTKDGYYRGIPTTLTSFLLATSLMLNMQVFSFHPNWWLWGYILFAILMPSSVRVKKV
ncbi:CDP-alcohol phosphatidyltransferase family protein [Candidatus Gracilibacteria bacterium]|nr:CDP-alcohol phosphatidyltransferase family protein [Candidatus Gracilibacteria bacterium]